MNRSPWTLPMWQIYLAVFVLQFWIRKVFLSPHFILLHRVSFHLYLHIPYLFQQIIKWWVYSSFEPTFAVVLIVFQSYGGHYGHGGGGGYGSGGWGGGHDDRMSNLGGGLRNVDWKSTKLTHFEKNFYIEDKRVAARSEHEINEFRRSKEMKVRRYPFSMCPNLTCRICSGSRSQCSKTCHLFWRGWLSWVSDDFHPCPRFRFAHSNPMPSLAHGPQR